MANMRNGGSYVNENVYVNAQLESNLEEPLPGLEELYKNLDAFKSAIERIVTQTDGVVSLDWAYRQFSKILLPQINKLLAAEAESKSPNTATMEELLKYQRELFLRLRQAFYTQPEYKLRKAPASDVGVTVGMLVKVFDLAIENEKDEIIAPQKKWDSVIVNIKLTHEAWKKSHRVIQVQAQKYAELFSDLQKWELFYQYTKAIEGFPDTNTEVTFAKLQKIVFGALPPPAPVESKCCVIQ